MNDNLGLGAYTAAHRTRQRGLEDGYVDKTGKREKKWRGWYHVYVKKDDGTETRIKRKRIIGPVVGMTKAEAEEEHRIWIRRFHTLPAAETPAATVATLCDDLFQLRDEGQLRLDSGLDHAWRSSTIWQSNLLQQVDGDVALVLTISEVVAGSVCADQHFLRHDFGDQFAIPVWRLLAYLGNGAPAILFPVGGQVLHEVTGKIVTKVEVGFVCLAHRIRAFSCVPSQPESSSNTSYWLHRLDADETR